MAWCNKFISIKKNLFLAMMDHFAPFREKRDEYRKHQDDVNDILKNGAAKASDVADKYLESVRQATGLNYRK